MSADGRVKGGEIQGQEHDGVQDTASHLGKTGAQREEREASPKHGARRRPRGGEHETVHERRGGGTQSGESPHGIEARALVPEGRGRAGARADRARRGGRPPTPPWRWQDDGSRRLAVHRGGLISDDLVISGPPSACDSSPPTRGPREELRFLHERLHVWHRCWPRAGPAACRRVLVEEVLHLLRERPLDELHGRPRDSWRPFTRQPLR